jgi:hypothetical protein
MNRANVPRSAVWLLETFKVSDNNPALIGDLSEEVACGCSRRWLWRQVLTAVLYAVSSEIVDYKATTVKALVAGQAVLWLGCWGVMQLPRVHWLSEFIVAVGRRLSVPYNANTFWFVGIPLGFTIVSIIAGWVVGRCHDNSIAFVLLFAMLQFLLILWSDSSEIHRLWAVSLDQSRFRPYFTLLMAYAIIDPVAVLFGGFLSGRPRRQRFPVS